MSRAERSQAVFGSFDGLTSLIGLLAGCIVAHASGSTILVESGGLAIAAAVGMASGDWLSGTNIRLSLVMGLSTLVGSLLPAVPIALIGGPVGYAVALVLTLTLAVLIAETRSATDGSRRKGYTSTFVILILASVLSVAASIGLGAVG